MAYVGAIVGALGALGGGALSSKTQTPDIYGGFNPLLGLQMNLLGQPIVSGKGGLMAPREGPDITNAIQAIYGAGGTRQDVIDLINRGIPVGHKTPAGLLSSLSISSSTGGPGANDILQTVPGIGSLFRKGNYKTVQLPSRFGFSYANPLFTPSDFETLAELKTPVPLNEAQLTARDLANTGRAQRGGFASTINDVIDYLNGPLAGYADELVRTGFPTDIGPIRDLANFNYRNTVLPEIANQFGALTNNMSSDFLGEGARAGSELEFGLGSLATELSERAMNRRAEGIPIAQALQQARAVYPLALSETLGGLGRGFQAEDIAQRPGNQILSLLNAVKSLSGGGGTPMVGPNSSPTNTAGLASGFLKSILGPLGSSIGGALGDTITSVRQPSSTSTSLNLSDIGGGSLAPFTNAGSWMIA